MKNLMTLLICTILILSACSSSNKIEKKSCFDLPLADSNIEDQEEYLIIESVLSKEFNDPNVVQITQETLSKTDSIILASYVNSDQYQFDSILVRDYLTLNNASFLWGELFTIKQSLINNDELECYFIDNAVDGWKSYYDKYEHSVGYLKFGRPIYNDDGEALVVYNHGCGIWCASGYAATLKKEDGKWVVKQNIMIWQS